MPLIAALFEGVVEIAEDLDGFDVDGVFGIDGAGCVARKEAQVLDVLVEFGGRESCERFGGIIRFEVVDHDRLKV